MAFDKIICYRAGGKFHGQHSFSGGSYGISVSGSKEKVRKAYESFIAKSALRNGCSCLKLSEIITSEGLRALEKKLQNAGLDKEQINAKISEKSGRRAEISVTGAKNIPPELFKQLNEFLEELKKDLPKLQESCTYNRILKLA